MFLYYVVVRCVMYIYIIYFNKLIKKIFKGLIIIFWYIINYEIIFLYNMSDYKLMLICVLNGMLDVEESNEFLFLMIFDMNIILNNLKFI